MKLSIWSIIVFILATVGIDMLLLVIYYAISHPVTLTWFETSMSVATSFFVVTTLWKWMTGKK